MLEEAIWNGAGLGTLRPVAGPAGDLLPRLLVDLVSILFDRKFLAARHAAKCHVASTDAELDFPLANLAFHS